MAFDNEQARNIFMAKGGTLRTAEAVAAGIHPRILYAMRDSGQLEQIVRGVYRLAELPPLSDPDMATVGKRLPHGVVCLISALAFHELTTQIPHVVHIAIPRTARTPRLDYPPIQTYRFSPKTFNAGIEKHKIDGVEVRIYNAEKTLADCFKYRNKLGLDIFIEALRNYLRKRGAKIQRVLEYARVCRVESAMRPYLETGI